MALSDTALRAINGKPYAGPAELSDRDGLGVRITPAGTITWQYRYRFLGKAARVTLGRYPDLKIADARQLIPGLRNALAQGTDPRQYWQQHTSPTGGTTLAELCSGFLDAKSSGYKPGTIGAYKSMFNTHLIPAFETRPVEDVTLGEWIAFFDDKAKQSPVLAGCILRNLKTVMNWAVRRQMIPTLDMMLLRVADVGRPAKMGTRVLTVKECGKIWQELAKSRATPCVINAIKLCMLTGCRVSEILKSRREDFDLDSMVWTVPPENSKTSQPIRRPIFPAMLAVLEMQWSFYGEAGWVIPAPNDRTRPLGIATVNKLVRELKPRLGIPDWRIHDCRRTISTRLSELGVAPHVTEKMLGHALGGVMAVYNKHDWLEAQCEAYQMWSDRLALAAYGDGKVSVLERRA